MVIRSLVEECLVCFHLLAIVNNIDFLTFVTKFLCEHVLIVLGYIGRHGIAE